MMHITLENKVALVTGATRGIGKAIAHALGECGATVIGTATSEVGAQTISDAISEAGHAGRGYQLNLTEDGAIDAFIKQVTSDFGAPHILVNNAGITRDNLMMRMKVEEWDSVVQTNLTAIFKLSKAVLRAMMKARWGRIISVGSIVGTTGNPGQANYCAAKAGVLGFSKSLAQEIASRNITVNVVAPGMIDTDMTRALSDEQREQIFTKIPLQRLGEPEDIANAVLFLASDMAAYITGETVHVNGGMFMA